MLVSTAKLSHFYQQMGHALCVSDPVYSGEADNLSCFLEGIMNDMNPLVIFILYPLVVSVWT